MLAHGGWSVSVTAIGKMVKSLMTEMQQIIWELLKDGLCAIAYDNLDFDFKPKEVTIENPGMLKVSQQVLSFQWAMG